MTAYFNKQSKGKKINKSKGKKIKVSFHLIVM